MLIGGVVLCAILLAQPLMALCGECGRVLEVLGCYYVAGSNTGCALVKCEVEEDVIGFPQTGDCCFDGYSCAF